MDPQPTLFGSEAPVPPGFQFTPGFITEEEEQDLVRAIERLEFSRVEMRGVVAKRRTCGGTTTRSNCRRGRDI